MSKTSTTATATITVPVPPAPSNILSERTGSAGTSFILLLLILALCLWASRALRLAREKLPGEGLLPRLARWAQLASRVAALLLGAELMFRLLPGSMSPAVPWLIVAGAAAIGWSARDFLPDVLAGLVLGIERKVRPGEWISGEEHAGTVEWVGLRATALRDARGQLIFVPNRYLIQKPVSTGAGPWPEVEVRFRAPNDATPLDVERLAREAALMLPWIAPHPVAIVRGEDGYVLRARVLEGRFLDAFSTALRDRIEEALASPPTS